MTTKRNRMDWAKAELAGKFCDVITGPDKWSLDVITPEGKHFRYRPMSGWFNEIDGSGTGRGIANMLRCSKGQKQKNKFGQAG